MTRCDDCPVLGVCVAERTGHTRYCDWARSGKPEYNRRVVELSNEKEQLEQAQAAPFDPKALFSCCGQVP